MVGKIENKGKGKGEKKRVIVNVLDRNEINNVFKDVNSKVKLNDDVNIGKNVNKLLENDYDGK